MPNVLEAFVSDYNDQVASFDPTDDEFNDAVEGDIDQVCAEYSLSVAQKCAALSTILVSDAIKSPVATVLTVQTLVQAIKAIHAKVSEGASVVGIDPSEVLAVLNAEAAKAICA